MPNTAVLECGLSRAIPLVSLPRMPSVARFVSPARASAEERRTHASPLSTADLSSSRGKAPTTLATHDGCLLRAARCSHLLR